MYVFFIVQTLRTSMQPTNLKNFHTELNTITIASDDLKKLQDCVDAAGASFNADTTVCSNFDDSPTTFNSKYTELMGYAYNSVPDRIFKQDITDLKNGIDAALQDETLPNKQKEIRELRNKLDNRMREIYHPEESDIYIDHRSGVYMSLAWTAIATSVLYYLFHILSKE